MKILILLFFSCVFSGIGFCNSSNPDTTLLTYKFQSGDTLLLTYEVIGCKFSSKTFIKFWFEKDVIKSAVDGDLDLKIMEENLKYKLRAIESFGRNHGDDISGFVIQKFTFELNNQSFSFLDGSHASKLIENILQQKE